MIYLDTGDCEEDERIQKIGESLLCLGKVKKDAMIAFVTDSEPPEKVERYISKLLKRFPGIRVVDRFPGPVQGCVSVRMGLVSTDSN